MRKFRSAASSTGRLLRVSPSLSAGVPQSAAWRAASSVLSSVAFSIGPSIGSRACVVADTGFPSQAVPQCNVDYSSRFVHRELQIIAYQGICAYRIDNLRCVDLGKRQRSTKDSFLKIRRMLRCAGERFCVILGLVNADESRKGRGPPRERAAFESVLFEPSRFAKARTKARNLKEREASRGALGHPHDMRRKDLS